MEAGIFRELESGDLVADYSPPDPDDWS